MPIQCQVITLVEPRMYRRSFYTYETKNDAHKECRTTKVVLPPEKSDITLEHFHAVEKLLDDIDFKDLYPTVCEHCNVPFVEQRYGRSWSPIYQTASGERITQSDAPTGAMWLDAETYLDKESGLQMSSTWSNKTDPVLLVKLPHGSWNIDSRASNCTRPDDKTHRCWVRTGEPPNITVGKSGDTCGAGAGSIRWGSPGEPEHFHAMLLNGAFHNCGDSAVPF